MTPSDQLKEARAKAIEALRAGDGIEYERWMQIVRPLARSQSPSDPPAQHLTASLSQKK